MNREFDLDWIPALVLLYFMRPREASSSAHRLANRFGIAQDTVAQVIVDLRRLNLLVATPEAVVDPRMEFVASLRRAWAEYGWVAACEYHLGTFDCEFIDGSPMGRVAAAQRMSDYAAAEADVLRESPKSATNIITLPPPSADLAPLQCFKQHPPKPLDLQAVGEFLSLAFGCVGKRAVAWNGASIQFRTSPSGGARQPTNGYLLAASIVNIPNGIHYVRSDPPQLELIATIPSDWLTRYFPVLASRSPFQVQGVVILTSLFERNMFRYRESRTFRTVHMDVGHIMATIDLVAAAHGLRVFSTYGGESAELEAALGVSALVEGIQATVALGTDLT
jgi:SagB-type dehydrogenase family enzyme